MLLLAYTTDNMLKLREAAIEDSLIVGIAEGDKDSFTSLYKLSGRTVYAYALSILKNTAEAEDVLQDTFLKIRSSAHLYVPQGKPMAWILTITKNVCLMRLRRQQNISFFPLENLDESAMLKEITDLEDRIVLKSALHILSPEECQIIILHSVTGCKHSEIAALLEMPVSTVLSKYHRGLKKLKAELEGKL